MIPTSLTGCTDLIKVLDDVLEDYSDAQESPVVTLKTPSLGTRVVSKNEETHTIDENKMDAVRMLIGSDMWVLHTDEEAVEDKQQKETIDELKDFIREQGGCVDDRDNRIEQLTVLNEALRADMELAQNLSRDHIAGQDRFINGLRKDLDARNKTIEEKNTVLQAYRDENTEVWSKLEKIGKIAEHPAYDCFSTALDEITKIIQEE